MTSCAVSNVYVRTNDLIILDYLGMYYRLSIGIWAAESYADENLRLQLSSSCDVDNFIVELFDVHYTRMFKL